MIEMAIGVAIFLVAALGAVQLGVSAVSAEGAQSAALVGARTASGAPVPGDPLGRLAEGQVAAETSLEDAVLAMARPERCTTEEGAAGVCGLPTTCVEYDGDRAELATAQPCPPGPSSAAGASTLGPTPNDLDGSQNPRCHIADCFGTANSMGPCARSIPTGQLLVCLAYTSWPATSVDIWIKGTLRTLVPLGSSVGVDALPVNVQLRLQVEALSS
ncbi:MAG: hypothetical protein ACRENX_03965 [Candidatus Dormibacteria bacterium]